MIARVHFVWDIGPARTHLTWYLEPQILGALREGTAKGTELTFQQTRTCCSGRVHAAGPTGRPQAPTTGDSVSVVSPSAPLQVLWLDASDQLQEQPRGPAHEDTYRRVSGTGLGAATQVGPTT